MFLDRFAELDNKVYDLTNEVEELRDSLDKLNNRVLVTEDANRVQHNLISDTRKRLDRIESNANGYKKKAEAKLDSSDEKKERASVSANGKGVGFTRGADESVDDFVLRYLRVIVRYAIKAPITSINCGIRLSREYNCDITLEDYFNESDTKLLAYILANISVSYTDIDVVTSYANNQAIEHILKF